MARFTIPLQSKGNQALTDISVFYSQNNDIDSAPANQFTMEPMQNLLSRDCSRDLKETFCPGAFGHALYYNFQFLSVLSLFQNVGHLDYKTS